MSTQDGGDPAPRARHIGIAGVSAEGAALCYRTICAEGPALLGPHAHPELTLHTIPLAAYTGPVAAGRWDQVASLLLRSAAVLQAAGAQLLICPDNTVHPAIEQLRGRSAVPWLHIADEVAQVARARGFQRLLVLGTRSLMEGSVYFGSLGPLGIEDLIPDPDDRARIDRTIFDDLVYGRFPDMARAFFGKVIARGKARGADAVVLGCTEIPLLVGPEDSCLPILDSTRILARAALSAAVAAAAR